MKPNNITTMTIDQYLIEHCTSDVAKDGLILDEPIIAKDKIDNPEITRQSELVSAEDLKTQPETCTESKELLKETLLEVKETPIVDVGNPAAGDDTSTVQEISHQPFFQEDNFLSDELKRARSKLSGIESDLINYAVKFGQVKSLNDIETLEINDPEDFAAYSDLLDMKKRANDIIKIKDGFNNIILLEPAKLHEAVDKAEERLRLT